MNELYVDINYLIFDVCDSICGTSTDLVEIFAVLKFAEVIASKQPLLLCVFFNLFLNTLGFFFKKESFLLHL